MNVAHDLVLSAYIPSTTPLFVHLVSGLGTIPSPPPLLPNFPLQTFSSNAPSHFPTAAAAAFTNTITHPSVPLVPSIYTATQPLSESPHFPDLPLIPAKLVSKILRWEYTDPSMLLPDQLQSLSSSANSVNEASIVVLPSATWETQRRERRQIPDIATWVQLFSTYMLILAQRYPNSLTDLIQYQLLLVKQARKFRYPSWLYYDTEFRKAASSDRSLSWAAVHPQIYALAFTNQGLPTAWCPICTVDNGQHTYDCPNFGGQIKPSSKPFTSSWSTPPLKKPRQTVDHCILYNQFDGQCRFGKQCRYPHRCASCGTLGHPMRNCPNPRAIHSRPFLSQPRP